MTANLINQSVDYLFVDYEVGIKESVVAGDDFKTNSFYIFRPSKCWKFREIKIGERVNIGDIHYSIGFGLTGFNASFGDKKSSVDIRVGLDKIGIEFSYKRD